MKTNVKILKTASNIEIWWVKETRLPLIALEWSVIGGSSTEQPQKAGVTSFMASLLDEGAGDLDATAFQEQMEDSAIELSFNTDRESFGGSLKTLTENASEAFRLMALALNAPRFDQDAIERVREQINAGLRRNITQPNAIAEEAFWSEAYKNHGLANPTRGTLATIAKLTKQDLEATFQANKSKATLKVAVVGMIEEAELIDYIEQMFGQWGKTIIKPVEAIAFQHKGTHVKPLKIPQTILQFGLKAPMRREENFMASFVMNHILGGGTFQARLMKEVREVRGLTYGIYTHLYPLSTTGLMIGGLSTKNEKALEAMNVVREEMDKLAAVKVEHDEIESAKNYLIGSYALRFDNSNSIAANLLRLMRDGFSPDYTMQRNNDIKKVSANDVQEQAKVILHKDNLLTIAVGEPEGF